MSNFWSYILKTQQLCNFLLLEIQHGSTKRLQPFTHITYIIEETQFGDVLLS